jgi:hypothetical protein
MAMKLFSGAGGLTTAAGAPVPASRMTAYVGGSLAGSGLGSYCGDSCFPSATSSM